MNKKDLINKNGYVDSIYLKSTANMFHDIKQQSYAKMKIGNGSKVLDVGCGIGIDTINMSKIVGHDGYIIGLDYDKAMIANANLHAFDAGVSTYVRHMCYDVNTMPFNNDQFDACRSERLFEHLDNSEQVFTELVRVAKYGGNIVIIDTDWSTLTINTDEIAIERKLIRYIAESYANNGFSGRKLYGMFNRERLADIDLQIFPIATTCYETASIGIQLQRIEQEAVKVGVLTQAELELWTESNKILMDEGRFFSSINMIMVSGTKTN